MQMTVQSRFVDVGGLKTHYLEAGEGDPLVLVHGGGPGADSSGNYSRLIEEMKDRYHIFAVDMIGFGRTDFPREPGYVFSQESREQHLAAFIEALRIGPVRLIGNSMGGLTSLGVARERPDLVRHLVLMGSAGIKVPLSPEVRTILDYDFTIEGMARIVKALAGPDFVPFPGMLEYRHKLTLGEDARTAYKGIADWTHKNGGLHVDESKISSVKVPTLVIGSKNDRVVPVTSAYRFLELIPQSWGVIMPACGHWPMIERPAEFARIVDSHFRDVEAR